MPLPLGHRTGLMSLDDLLEIRFRSPLAYGLSSIEPVLRRDLEIHNELTTDMVSRFAVISDDYQRLYGTSDTLEMIEADEFSRAHTQKGKAGSAVGFPMRGFMQAIGWDRAYFERATVADMAQSQLSAEKGHVQKIRLEMQKAMYLSANYSFTDYRDTKVALAVKRFLNADGADIPDGPQGQTFNPATHTHYLATAAVTNADVTALIRTVIEHHSGGMPALFINQADEAAVTALTSFKPFIDSRLTVNANVNQTSQGLDVFTTDNRAIGIFGAAVVWVKPWALAGYYLATDIGAGAPRPLVCRVRRGQRQVQLKIAAKLDIAPLYAEYMESEFGFGVYTRTNGAVLYTGGGAYVDPTL